MGSDSVYRSLSFSEEPPLNHSWEATQEKRVQPYTGQSRQELLQHPQPGSETGDLAQREPRGVCVSK